jgi:peptidoglycan-N-acetylglucosamine deacetylase
MVTEPQKDTRGGVCLTFDDAHIEDWHATLPVLRKYNAKATFFISGFPGFSAKQISLLHRIQADGHEIGYHTVHHHRAPEFVQNHSMEDYLAEEITPGVDAMKQSGFDLKSMAYQFMQEPMKLIWLSTTLFRF